MLQGPIDVPDFECQEVSRPWHGKAEVLADLGEMFTARSSASFQVEAAVQAVGEQPTNLLCLPSRLPSRLPRRTNSRFLERTEIQ